MQPLERGYFRCRRLRTGRHSSWIYEYSLGCLYTYIRYSQRRGLTGRCPARQRRTHGYSRYSQRQGSQGAVQSDRGGLTDTVQSETGAHRMLSSQTEAGSRIRYSQRRGLTGRCPGRQRRALTDTVQSETGAHRALSSQTEAGSRIRYSQRRGLTGRCPARQRRAHGYGTVRDGGSQALSTVRQRRAHGYGTVRDRLTGSQYSQTEADSRIRYSQRRGLTGRCPVRQRRTHGYGTVRDRGSQGAVQSDRGGLTDTVQSEIGAHRMLSSQTEAGSRIRYSQRRGLTGRCPVRQRRTPGYGTVRDRGSQGAVQPDRGGLTDTVQSETGAHRALSSQTEADSRIRYSQRRGLTGRCPGRQRRAHGYGTVRDRGSQGAVQSDRGGLTDTVQSETGLTGRCPVRQRRAHGYGTVGDRGSQDAVQSDRGGLTDTVQSETGAHRALSRKTEAGSRIRYSQRQGLTGRCPARQRRTHGYGTVRDRAHRALSRKTEAGSPTDCSASPPPPVLYYR